MLRPEVHAVADFYWVSAPTYSRSTKHSTLCCCPGANILPFGQGILIPLVRTSATRMCRRICQAYLNVRLCLGMSCVLLGACHTEVVATFNLRINGTVAFYFPPLRRFNCKENVNVGALQPVRSDRIDKAGKWFTYRIAGDHQHCWYLPHVIQSLVAAIILHPDT